MTAPTRRDTLFVFFAVGLWWGWAPDASNHRLGAALASLLGLAILSWRISPRTGLLVLVAMIPGEYSVPRFGLPSLSPIDLMVLPLGLSLLVNRHPKTLFQQLRNILTPWGLVFVALFLGYAGVSTLVLHSNPKGLLRWGEFIFFLLYAAQLDPDQHPHAPRLVASLVLALSLGVALTALPVYIQAHGDYRQLQGVFKQNNILAAFLSFSLAPAIALVIMEPRRGRQALTALSLGSVAIVFWLTFSRGAFLGLFCALGVLRVASRFSALSQRRGLIVLGGLAAFIGIVLLGSHPRIKNWCDNNGRLRYWQVGACILESHPWTGVGADRYLEQVPGCLYPEELHAFRGEMNTIGRPDIWQHLHNLWLQTAVNFGLPAGLCLFVGLLIPLMRRLQPPSPATPWSSWHLFFLVSLLAFFVHNMVDILFVNSLDLLFAIYLGLTRPS